MPARMTGREFFGRRLRIAREQQVPKMSRRALGERINLSDSAIAAWESGRNIPDPETLEDVERILGTGGLLEDIAENIVTGEKPQEYMGRWAQAEAQATVLLRFSFDVFPGLLQIEEYARSILRDEEQVKTQKTRQKVIAKENPPNQDAHNDEREKNRNEGGPSVMTDQLKHVEEMALHDHVIIQVIKLSSAVGAQFTGTFSLAIGEAAAGYLDDALSGDVVETPDEVSRLRRIFEMLRKHALSEEASLRLIKEVAEAWQAKI